jgi:hypothetical protein
MMNGPPALVRKCLPEYSLINYFTLVDQHVNLPGSRSLKRRKGPVPQPTPQSSSSPLAAAATPKMSVSEARLQWQNIFARKPSPVATTATTTAAVATALSPVALARGYRIATSSLTRPLGATAATPAATALSDTTVAATNVVVTGISAGMPLSAASDQTAISVGIPPFTASTALALPSPSAAAAMGPSFSPNTHATIIVADAAASVGSLIASEPFPAPAAPALMPMADLFRLPLPRVSVLSAAPPLLDDPPTLYPRVQRVAHTHGACLSQLVRHLSISRGHPAPR